MAAEVCWNCMRRNLLMANSLRVATNQRLYSVSKLLRSSTGVSEERQTTSLPQQSDTSDIDKSTTVTPEVAKILVDSRPCFVNNNWHKPKISARQLAEFRKSFLSQGYYWPEKPLIDRGLDKTPKGHRYEREKEARLAKIEENMKNMPRIIEEYRKKMKEQRSKRKDERKASNLKSAEAKRLGIHPKDPRGLGAAGQDSKNKNKKFQKKTK